MAIYTNSGAVYNIGASNPFEYNPTPTTFEGQRRVSCAMVITYTGTLERASGLIRIGRGPMITSLDTQLEIVTASGAVSTMHNVIGTDEDAQQVPVTALLNGPLVILPKPQTQEAEDFTTTLWPCPFPQGNKAAPWEEVWVTCMGYDPLCTFNFRFVEILEAQCGVNSPFKSFVTPSPKLALGWTAGESHMLTYAKKLAESVGSYVTPENISNVIYAVGAGRKIMQAITA
jgi:hypothetical protein